MNENIKKFRQEIAAKEKEQRNAKEQRRTVRFTGERTMSPSEAYYKVLDNKYDLRIMYAAYGLMRGRKFSQIESHWDGKDEGVKHPLLGYAEGILSLLQKYNYTMDYEEKDGYWGKKYKTFKENCDETVVCLGEPKA